MYPSAGHKPDKSYCVGFKVYYYLRNATFHEAAGQVEYCHSEGSNKPDIQHK